MTVKDKLVVALDVDSLAEAVALAGQLKDYVGCFKIGMQLYYSQGRQVVETIGRLGGGVFVDLKLHDIPNTAAQAGRVITRQGVTMFNVHVAGGRKMMESVARAAEEEALNSGIKKPLVIGVTILTSIDEETWQELGYGKPLKQLVLDWARLAQDCGLDGVVTSPREAAAIKAACGDDFLIVTPGVRPRWAGNDDQKRVVTPREAIAAGASYLVVGRPVTQAVAPVAAAQKILAEMEEGIKCLTGNKF